jgi:hypothetical protein
MQKRTEARANPFDGKKVPASCRSPGMHGGQGHSTLRTALRVDGVSLCRNHGCDFFVATFNFFQQIEILPELHIEPRVAKLTWETSQGCN